MRIFVAGHRGMVGSAICRLVSAENQHELITASSSELDLRDTIATREFIRKHKPDQVILAAAKVGGILANNHYPAEFIADNLAIQNNVIIGAHQASVEQLLFLGSSCIYPKFAEQPIKETALLTGVLEATNEPYAIAKIAGIKLCESYNRQYGTDYRSIMPTNLYGPGDNFDLKTSHVLPALIRKMVNAKNTDAANVTIWGSGTPRREFLHVDDMAKASLHLLRLDKKILDAHVQPMLSHVNAGFGDDISIAELAKLVKEIVGFDGKLVFDTSKPDGTPRKLMDSSLIHALGWKAQIDLATGITETIEWCRIHRMF